MDLSVTVPIYNEEENLPVLFERLHKVCTDLGVSYELIFVNDGSADRSLAMLKELSAQHPEVHYVDLSRNFGHQIAISAGLDHSRGDAVVIIDGDLQDPPELIPELYAGYREGYKIVYAKRKSRKGVSIFKKAAYLTFYRILKAITHVNIPLDTGDFRLIDREVVNQLKGMREQEKFLRGQIAWMGFSQKAVEYDRDPRLAGSPGYSFGKLVSLALDGIFSFSNFPLRVATISGFAVSVLAFLWMGWILYMGIARPEEDIQGWYSIMVAVLFLGGVQLISIGIIGEYISRLSSNIKDRPLYLVNSTSFPPANRS